jgi:hypothetical protein
MSEITESQYRELKKDVEESKSKADKARGALEATTATLKKDYGVSTLKEAKAKLVKLEAKTAEAKLEFERAYKEYKKKWKPDAD